MKWLIVILLIITASSAIAESGGICGSTSDIGSFDCTTARATEFTTDSIIQIDSMKVRVRCVSGDSIRGAIYYIDGSSKWQLIDSTYKGTMSVDTAYTSYLEFIGKPTLDSNETYYIAINSKTSTSVYAVSETNIAYERWEADTEQLYWSLAWPDDKTSLFSSSSFTRHAICWEFQDGTTGVGGGSTTKVIMIQGN